MMALLLLLLPAFAQDDPVEALDEPIELVEDSGDSGLDEAEDADEPGMPTVGKRKPRKKRNKSSDEVNRDRWYMAAIGGLLVLWLGLRLLQPAEKKVHRRRPERPSPVGDDELGRMVFVAIQHADLHEYRQLFLNGGEARKVMGSEASVYLERMSPDAMEDALVDVSVFVPQGCVFGGTERDGDTLSLIVKDHQGNRRSVEVGTTVHVGGVLRLREPA